MQVVTIATERCELKEIRLPEKTSKTSTFRGGGVNRFSPLFGSSDFTEKIVRISDLSNVLHGFRILLIQQIADLSNILAPIADFASNLGGSADLGGPSLDRQ